MRVVFSPWRSALTTAATSHAGKRKNPTSGTSSSIGSGSSLGIEASFVSGQTAARTRGRGGGGSGRKQSKRQRRKQRQAGATDTTSLYDDGSGQHSYSYNSNSNSATPLLTLTSDHRVCVLSSSSSSSSSPSAFTARSSESKSTAALSAVAEDPRWNYESRPGAKTSFLPITSSSSSSSSSSWTGSDNDQPLNGNKKKKKARSASKRLAGSTSKGNDDVDDENDACVVPCLPAIFDASSIRIFALQNNNTVLSCWDASSSSSSSPYDANYVSGPPDESDTGSSSSSSSRVTFPDGRYAISMQCLPGTDSSPVDGGGVAGVLDDGTIYVARFVIPRDSADDNITSRATGLFKVGYFAGTDEQAAARRSKGGKGRGRGRLGAKGSKQTATTESLRHLTTIISPGSGVSSSASTPSGKKRKPAAAADSSTDAAGGGGDSYTIRVLFYDEDCSSLRLIRHNITVQGSQRPTPDDVSDGRLGGEIELLSYPPIYLTQPIGGGPLAVEEEEEPMIVSPRTIQCARLDSTALAVAFCVSDEADADDDDDGDGAWYCIHLEGRTGEVTTAPFPLEILPGWSVANIAGLAPNLVAVLSSPSAAAADEAQGGVASLMVYDIRRSVAVQSVNFPIKDDENSSTPCVGWTMLSDYRDGSIAILGKAEDFQSISVSVSKLVMETNDTEMPSSRSLHQAAAIRKKYNLASAVSSALSVSEDIASTNLVLSSSRLGRDVRSILPMPSNDKSNDDGGAAEIIVSETMQAIDDVFVAFELDGLRMFLVDPPSGDDSMASFETAYDQAVCSLLEASPQGTKKKSKDKDGESSTDIPVNGNSSAGMSSPKSIANGSSNHEHARRTREKRKTGINTTLLPQAFVDGAFDTALGIITQPSGPNDHGDVDAHTDKKAAAVRVMVKLIRTGKVSAREYLGGGVLRSILLACRRLDVPSAAAGDETPTTALSVIDSILSHCSSDIPETVLVAMLHYILCYVAPDNMVAFYCSGRHQKRQNLVPEKVQILIDARNETSAEILLIEKEKSIKKRGKIPSKKRREEINTRIEELTKISDDLSTSILSAGTIHFADRIVSYSMTNGSLLRSALVDVLVHAKRGEVTALLSVLTKLILLPTSTSNASIGQSTCRTTSIAQWVSALTDAHLPALLSAEGTKYVAAAREAVAASAAQAEVVAGMQDLIHDAMASCSASVAAASNASAGKVVTYDSTGQMRTTTIKKGQEEKRSGPIPPYSVERLSI